MTMPREIVREDVVVVVDGEFCRYRLERSLAVHPEEENLDTREGDAPEILLPMGGDLSNCTLSTARSSG